MRKMEFSHSLAQQAFNVLCEVAESMRGDLLGSALNPNDVQQFMFDGFVRAIEVAIAVEIDMMRAGVEARCKKEESEARIQREGMVQIDFLSGQVKPIYGEGNAANPKSDGDTIEP